MHVARILGVGFVGFLLFAPALAADDACEGLDGKVVELLQHPASWQMGTREDEIASRTITRFRHEGGYGYLFQWNFGAAGRIECAYHAYRTAGEFKVIRSENSYIQIQDIDNDQIDELILLDNLPWSMDCTQSMATLPHRLKIAHFDAASGTLKDVSRSYGGYASDFLKRLSSNYGDFVGTRESGVPDDCQHAWVDLLKETYNVARFRMILGVSALSIITFAVGLSKSPRWKWTSRIVGALLLVVSIGSVFYSLGTVGWHCLGFCDLWSAVQVVTGFKVHSLFLDVVSVLVTALGGGKLLLS